MVSQGVGFDLGLGPSSGGWLCADTRPQMLGLATARLFLGNGVVIAITLGIVLNAVLRAALGREAQEPL